MTSADICPFPHSDYFAVAVSFTLPSSRVRGPAYWKLNTFLLDDEECIATIKGLWTSWRTCKPKFRSIECMMAFDGTLASDIETILDIWSDFYKSLFTAQTTDQKIQDDFLECLYPHNLSTSQYLSSKGYLSGVPFSPLGQDIWQVSWVGRLA